MSDIRDVAEVGEGDLCRWMVGASPDGLWVFDRDGRTVFANARMADLLRRTPEEMVGFSVFDAVDEVGKEQFRGHLEELASVGRPGSNLECSLLDANGHRFWALVSHTPLIDDEGTQRGWMHRVSEHSDQKRLLDQLAEAQAIARIGSWEWDVGADRVSWSDELYRIYGLEPHELTPTYEGFLSQIHPDDRDLVSGVVGRALESEDSFEFDARVSRSSGEIVWIRGRGVVLRGPDGRAIRMGGTTQDITEKKDAEQALALLTAMATAANEAATLAEALPAVLDEVARHTTWRPVLAVVVDADGGLGAPIRAHDGTEASALPVEVGLGFAERAACSRSVVAEPSQEGTVVVAVPVLHEDRVACVVVLDMRSTLPPVASDGATIGQITSLFARVAEREWTAERLAQARDDAMAASRAKSEFLATMSHEIRTPLNGVIGLTELLSRTELTQHQRRLADGIDQAGRVLLDLVNDILDLSKIEAGRLELETVDFDPAAVLERSAGLLAERARAKSLDLTVTHGADVPYLVSGDPVRFGQVVSNLTSNAVKFTDSGAVSVRLTLEADGPAGPLLRVDVTDTGAGITPEVHDRLFESFAQGDSSTTRQYGGTGLGLAISRQIVDALGGEIGVASAAGEGSRFWFTARFGPATGDGAAGRSPASTAAVTTLRVLLVGGERVRPVAEQLDAWSVRTTTAGAGIEGLVALDSAHRADEPVDVVLLDEPGDGSALHVARTIRLDHRFTRTRVVVLLDDGPHGATGLAGDLAAAGVDASLTLPVMPSSLFDVLASAAGEHLAAGARDDVVVAARDVVTRPGVRGTVLVVEDNDINQLVAQGVLESLGYSVVVAANGVEGVAAHAELTSGVDGGGGEASAGPLVAVLMDCQMPQMDGYEATRRIRDAEGRGPRVPVIAMTASAIAGERERCLRAGMDDFLTKPVDVALLASTLQRWTAAEGARTPSRRPASPSGQAVPSTYAARSGEAGEVAPGSRPGTDDSGSGEAIGVRAGGPPAEPDEDVLDDRRLAELRDLEPGDPSLLLRFIDRFGDGARQRLADLREAHTEGDAETQGRIAHGLKGSASNLGASALADVCKTVEDLGSAGELADPDLVARVGDEVDRATRALEGYAARLRAIR